jgi:hypothetical protein
MDLIKEAFQKIKEDMYSLQYQLEQLKSEIFDVKSTLNNIFQQLNNQQANQQQLDSLNFQLNLLKDQYLQIQQTLQQTNQQKIQTIQQENTLNKISPASFPADNLSSKALLTQDMHVSTGNEGVPANSQTDKQSDNSTGNEGVKFALISKDYLTRTSKPDLNKVKELINSLDEIKKDIRTKVKKLTNQEMIVFSTIFELESKGFLVDYPLLAQSLKLTESSIRDYVQRILKKGIPIEKYKENNKKVLVKVSEDFKKLTNLQTLLQLREL